VALLSLAETQAVRDCTWGPALEAIAGHRYRRHYGLNPVLWVKDRLGEFLWSMQKKIMYSVRDYRETSVQSCHGIGKSWIAARVVAWWIDSHPPGEAIAVTSAPTGRQVRAILWKEISRAHARGLAGRTNQVNWFMNMPNGKEELVAFGMKPSDTDPAAFQGIHARWVLVVFDEACGIPGGDGKSHSLWEAAGSLLANDDSRQLNIGNPDDPQSEFARTCKPGSGANVIQIGYKDTPNFTGETVPDSLQHLLIGPRYVEEKRKKWGEKNPLYISKILGQFPESTTDGLIPMAWIRAAQARELKSTKPIELGVDVGAGGDLNVVAKREGPVARIIRRDQESDTMVSCGNLLADIKEHKASVAKVDKIGIGKGMVDRAIEQKKPVIGVNVGQAAKDPESFANLKAEGYWALRERFQAGLIDIDETDDNLAAQLVELRFKRTSGGKIQIESKGEMKRRLGHSPDDADAVMLAYIDPPEEEIEEGGVLW
jgi:hypothetical protein